MTDLNELKKFFNGKRGPPLGNQNARKHGFYSRVLQDKQKYDLKQAAFVEGLDEEIDLLRVKLKAVVEKDTDNVRLISLAAVSLARLIRTKNGLKKDNKANLNYTIGTVLCEIAGPLGVDLKKCI